MTTKEKTPVYHEGNGSMVTRSEFNPNPFGLSAAEHWMPRVLRDALELKYRGTACWNQLA